MKIWEGEQRSEEWHKEFRANGIGASEAAKVLGLSKYGGALEVWEEKTGRAFPTPINEDMQRGIDNEDIAREAFENLVLEKFPAMCGTHDKYDCIKASFDGVNKVLPSFAEIKCSRSKRLLEIVIHNDEVALRKEFPDYWVQIQHQYCVFQRAADAYLVLYQNNKVSSMIVNRCDEFINDTLIPGITSFWNDHVITDTPPEPEHIVIDDPEAVSIAVELHNVMESKKEIGKKEKELRSALFDFTDDGNCVVGDLCLTRYSREKIDYKQAALDGGVDLTKYTTEGIGFWRITGSAANTLAAC